MEAFSRLASSRARCADAECAICMDTLDATDLVGGFKRMTGGSHARMLATENLAFEMRVETRVLVSEHVCWRATGHECVGTLR